VLVVTSSDTKLLSEASTPYTPSNLLLSGVKSLKLGQAGLVHAKGSASAVDRLPAATAAIGTLPLYNAL
jgi:hypothetical protein